jgi:branched-chain amino acid transport system ATP-binding protein
MASGGSWRRSRHPARRVSNSARVASREQSSPGRSEAVLRASSVSRAFAGVQALDEVTFELARHEVVGLIGPNGAGKTTLINLVTGFDRPDSGTIQLDGDDATGWSAPRRARAGLARTFQHGHLFGGLSVRENVELAALGVGARAQEARRRANELLDVLGIGPLADRLAGALPHGDESKVGVARALANGPHSVLMDEPAAGFPEAEVGPLIEAIRRVRDHFRAGVLLVDHNMALIMEVSDRIQVLDHGRTLAEGSPAEIKRNIDVAAAYLGSSGVREEPTSA